jgi:biopolymer transport protein ExbD
MAAVDQQQGGAISAINVTPFVDVVLVLLVILMVTSTSLVKASIGVDLPKAAAASDTVDRTLNLVIEADGDLLLDGQPIAEAALTQAISAAVTENPEVRAVISADKDAPYHAVIRGIDLAKGAGLGKFALDVERGEP